MDKESRAWAQAEIILKASWLERFFFFIGARDLDAASRIFEEEWTTVKAECHLSSSLQALHALLLETLSWTRMGQGPSTGVEVDNAQPWGPVIIRQMPGKGRGLVALRDLKRGEKIFWQRPAVWVPDPTEGADVCSGCLSRKSQSPIRHCGAVLCGQPCQELRQQFFCEPLSVIYKHEELQKHVEAVQEIQARLWNQFPGVISLVLYVLAAFVQEARSLGRIATLSMMQTRGLLPTPAREFAPFWEDLGVPGQSWDSKEARLRHLQELEPHFLVIAFAFATILEKGSPVYTTDSRASGIARLFDIEVTLSQLFGQVDTVLMWVGGSKLQASGVAIVPSVALLNHSCIPNISTRFGLSTKPAAADCVLQEGGAGVGSSDAGFWAWLEAVRDIQQGEELTISYVDRSDVLEERQTILNQFGFSCACPRCVLEEALQTDMRD